ncbi:alpha-amylase amy3 [Cystoisospora suis]|uniref:Alpha-amylase amy3 n=1 Tax=Cystoisospora suis TaxID=483139 RepID=A0A2C6L8D3_9APIC|nr:alpha-amylase amy3 [Cystoisospora suis]
MKQEGPPSDKIRVRTGEPGKPSAPSELVCLKHAENSITISWKSPADHGGTPIRYYRIYKDGIPIAFVPAITAGVASFVDDTVSSHQSYLYQVSAWCNLPPVGCSLPCSVGDENARRFASLFAASITSSPIEGLLSEPLEARAVDMLRVPRLNDGVSHILLQGFNWVSARNENGWYNVVKSKLGDIKRLGATIIWLPPPTESVSWEGYMPTRWYNLQSKYGSAEDLKDLIRTAAAFRLSCCVDVVANHRCATRQDRNGHWTVFEDPSWGPWAVVCNNLQGYKGEGSFDTGTLVDCAPDIDHTNRQVQKDIKAWLNWLVHEVGYTAVRLDMAGGYGASFQKQYIDSVDRPFAVGEYWDGCTENLVNYVRAGQGALAAFDFALYYVLKRCVESQDFRELNASGNINGLVGVEPQLAVTFIENHDTDHLDYCSTFGGGNLDAVLQGYTFILTHPGVPCIYWNYFSDYGPYCRQKLQELCDVRIAMGIHSTSGVYMARTEPGLYAAYLAPRSRDCRPENATAAMKIGYRDWSPDGHGWTIATCGTNFCVWTR